MFRRVSAGRSELNSYLCFRRPQHRRQLKKEGPSDVTCKIIIQVENTMVDPFLRSKT